MNKITTVGIELAKNVFQLHGIDAAGKVVRIIGRDALPSTVIT